MTALNKWPCPGKPEELAGQPIGMYHCEFCGEMQLAGVAHLPPQFPSQWEEPFPKVEDPLTPLPEACAALHAAAVEEDDAEVMFYLEELLRHPVEETKDVWEKIDAFRDDPSPSARCIFRNLSLKRRPDGTWEASLRDDDEGDA